MHHSNLPEGAASNPFAPYNVDDRCLRHDVYRRTRNLVSNTREEVLISFDDVEDAVAFVGNTEDHYGQDLWVVEVDLRTDDEVCVLAAEFDDELGRYLN